MYDEWRTALKHLAGGAKPKSKLAIHLGISVSQALVDEIVDKLMDLGYVEFSDGLLRDHTLRPRKGEGASLSARRIDR